MENLEEERNISIALMVIMGITSNHLEAYKEVDKREHIQDGFRNVLLIRFFHKEGPWYLFRYKDQYQYLFEEIKKVNANLEIAQEVDKIAMMDMLSTVLSTFFRHRAAIAGRITV